MWFRSTIAPQHLPQHVAADRPFEQARGEHRAVVVEHVQTVVEARAARRDERAVGATDPGRPLEQHRATAELVEYVSSDQATDAAAEDDGVETFDIGHGVGVAGRCESVRTIRSEDPISMREW